MHLMHVMATVFISLPMVLAQFLSIFKLTELDILNYLLSISKVNQIDIVFISGSLVEGIGNRKSDIDIFSISDCLEKELQILFIPRSECQIDFEKIPLKSIDLLINKLSCFPADQERDLSSSLELSVSELNLLHRISIGKSINQAEALANIQRQIDKKSLSRILFDRAIGQTANLLTDIQGLLIENDYENALLLAQQIAGLTVDAILAAQGNTNNNSKWRFRLLRRLEKTGFTFDLPFQLRGEGCADRLLKTYMFNDLVWGSEKKYVSSVCRLARHIAPWGQRIFFENKVVSSKNLDKDIKTNEYTGKILPDLAVDVRFRYENQRILLFRIGGNFELEINDAAEQILNFFDGETSVGEVARFFTADEEEFTVLEEMIERLLDVVIYYRLIN
jgi:hypothetical protein